MFAWRAISCHRPFLFHPHGGKAKTLSLACVRHRSSYVAVSEWKHRDPLAFVKAGYGTLVGGESLRQSIVVTNQLRNAASICPLVALA